MRSLPVNEGAFTVLLTFDCKPDESERLARALGDFVANRMRFHAGFLSGMVYLSDDATRVIELFQWARAGDWDRYRASEDGRDAVHWLAGRGPAVQFLETVCAVGAPAPGAIPK